MAINMRFIILTSPSLYDVPFNGHSPWFEQAWCLTAYGDDFYKNQCLNHIQVDGKAHQSIGHTVAE
jgi:hypothetical protein